MRFFSVDNTFKMLSLSLRSILFMICFVYGSYAENAYTNADGVLPLKKFKTKSYYFGDTLTVTFFEAIEICNTLGMQLVSIPNHEVNEFLRNTVKTSTKTDNHYWTSGIDLFVKRGWIWLTAGLPVVYTNWGTKEPNNEKERCIQLRGKHFKWNDIFCNMKCYFICESRDDE